MSVQFGVWLSSIWLHTKINDVLAENTKPVKLAVASILKPFITAAETPANVTLASVITNVEYGLTEKD